MLVLEGNSSTCFVTNETFMALLQLVHDYHTSGMLTATWYTTDVLVTNYHRL